MDILTPAERSMRMSRIRSKDTGPEMAVRRLIHSLGYRYRLHDPVLPGCPDMVFKARRKVVFVHGCFWHLHRDCPNCRRPKSRIDYWTPKLEQNAARDRRVCSKLRQLGWKCLVVWECELDDEDRLRRKVARFLDAL